MEEHYCQYTSHTTCRSDKECGVIARFLLYKRWYCAEHYDALMAAETRAFRDGYEAAVQRSKRG